MFSRLFLMQKSVEKMGTHNLARNLLGVFKSVNEAYKIMVVSFLLLFSMTPALLAYSPANAEKEMVRIRKSEPTFSEIAREALKRERLDIGEVQNWKKKIRKAPWLPTLSVGYDRALRETSAITISDNVSVSTSGVAVGPDETDRDQTLVNGDTFRVRAIWDLSEVVFHKSTLAVSQEGREISKGRTTLTDYLFKIYAERREAQAQYFLLKGSGNPKKILFREKVQALSEQLDLFTDDKFSGRWRNE